MTERRPPHAVARDSSEADGGGGKHVLFKLLRNSLLDVDRGGEVERRDELERQLEGDEDDPNSVHDDVHP